MGGRGDGWGRTGGRGPVAPCRAAWPRSTPCSPPHSTPPRLLRVVLHQPCCSACVRWPRGWGRRGGHGGGRDRRVGSGGEGEGNRRRERRRKVGRGGEEWMGGVVREEIRSRGSDRGRDKDGSRWDSLTSAPRVVVEAAWVPYVCASVRLAVPKSLP